MALTNKHQFKLYPNVQNVIFYMSHFFQRDPLSEILLIIQQFSFIFITPINPKHNKISKTQTGFIKINS